jgi:hypothetical protein
MNNEKNQNLKLTANVIRLKNEVVFLPIMCPNEMQLNSGLNGARSGRVGEHRSGLAGGFGR